MGGVMRTPGSVARTALGLVTRCRCTAAKLPSRTSRRNLDMAADAELQGLARGCGAATATLLQAGRPGKSMDGSAFN